MMFRGLYYRRRVLSGLLLVCACVTLLVVFENTIMSSPFSTEYLRVQRKQPGATKQRLMSPADPVKRPREQFTPVSLEGFDIVEFTGGHGGRSSGLSQNATDQYNRLVTRYWKNNREQLKSTHHDWPLGPGSGRPEQCMTKDYGDLSELPTASIIMTFHESEKLLSLLHTLHSIFQHTPPELLEEVILINDNSNKEEHQDVLVNYMDAIFGAKARLVRSRKSLGLIRGRLLGSRLARGDVIVSMDSHLEMHTGWLEPMLYEIKKNPKTLAAATLDWMKPDVNTKRETGRWTYEHGPSTWVCFFEWNMGFGFQDLPEYEKNRREKGDPTEPVKTPVTIGTVFAIDKQWFRYLGEFDPEMEAWGGENIDLALRVWFCEGQVVNLPCTHTAHLEEEHMRDYRDGWAKYSDRNFQRVAETLFDEYKELFYIDFPHVRGKDPGDLTQRKEIREKCPHNMEWYLENVFPQLGIPDRKSLAWGGVRNLGTGRCLDGPMMDEFTLHPCHFGTTQSFFWNWNGELRMPMSIYNLVDWEDSYKFWQEGAITLWKTDLSTRWIHWRHGFLKVYGKDICLEATKTEHKFIFSKCDITNEHQKWVFSMYSYEYFDLIKRRRTPPEDKNTPDYIRTYHQALLKEVEPYRNITETRVLTVYNGPSGSWD